MIKTSQTLLTSDFSEVDRGQVWCQCGVKRQGQKEMKAIKDQVIKKVRSCF